MSTFKKIDRNSVEGADSSLNLFDLPPSNVAINRSSNREFLPLSTITQEGPYVFRVFADNQFIDLSKTWLYLELSLEVRTNNSNWTKLDDSDNVSVIQSIGQSFVRQLKISMNNIECFDSGVNYAYRSYIQQELGLSYEVLHGLYQSSGYSKDTQEPNNLTGEGFKQRAKWFEKSSNVRLMSKLNFDLAQQPNYILNNTDILFTLYRNSDDFLLLYGAPMITLNENEATVLKEYRVKVQMIKMYVKTVDVAQSLNNAISKHIEKTPAKYGLKKIDVRNVFVGKGRLELSYNVFNSIIPRRIIVGFVAADAFAGARYQSSFVFENANVRSICVEANGFVYPSAPYQLDFSKGNFVRAFVDMYSGLGMDEGNKTCGITMPKYCTSHCFFVIPLTATLGDEPGFELVKNGTTCIKVAFNKEVGDKGYEMVVFAEFDQVITIDRDRVLTSDGTI